MLPDIIGKKGEHNKNNMQQSMKQTALTRMTESLVPYVHIVYSCLLETGKKAGVNYILKIFII